MREKVRLFAADDLSRARGQFQFQQYTSTRVTQSDRKRTLLLKDILMFNVAIECINELTTEYRLVGG